MARTWGEGQGAQCTRARVASSRLCRMHAKQQGSAAWLGEVDGPIPDAKLKEFQKRGKPRALPDAEPRAGTLQEVGDGAHVVGASVGGFSGGCVARLSGAGFGEVARPGSSLGAGSSASAGVDGGVGRSRLRRSRVAPDAAESSSLPSQDRLAASPAAVGLYGVDPAAAAAATPPGVRVSVRGPRVVSGFGDERVEDVAAAETQRISEGARRGAYRRDEGLRGRMRDMADRDLDRSAGGAWGAGKR